MECRVDLTTYRDFPAAEWVVYFRNAGEQASPILADIRPLDLAWPVNSVAVLHRSRGSRSSLDDFLYTSEPLGNAPVRMAAGGGRSSNDWLPFFNLQSGDAGVIVAVGWSGQWAAQVVRAGPDQVRLSAGQELTHLKLHPGEEIRTPRIALLFWNGAPLDGHNLWRRFVLAHHTPQRDGRPVTAPLCCSTWGATSDAAHFESVCIVQREKLPYEVYWVDAGWYGPPEAYAPDVDSSDSTWSRFVGDWRPNPVPHPHGLKPVSDAAHAAGMKFLLWVESERAVDGMPWTREHPEWYLHSRASPEAPSGCRNLLFDLGNPEARRFLTDFLSRLIAENGLDWYRQDFNIEPLLYWREADAPDRQGMAEIRHIEGLYAMWDELLQRHPGLMIDNCASGGRRIDLELISRSLPLWRSDWQCLPDFNAAGGQVETLGLAYWVPLSACGTNLRPSDTYNFRSALSAGIVLGLIGLEHSLIAPNYPFDWHRRMLAEFLRARPFFYGDYYPLLPISAALDVWAAYQFHRPDLDAGLVAVFRREHSAFVSADLPLHGLEPQNPYELEDTDTGTVETTSGAALASAGLRVTLDAPRSSKLIFYRKPG